MRETIYFILFSIIYGCNSYQEFNGIPDKELLFSIDSIMNSKCHSYQPGAAIIITKEGKEFYKGAFGLANLELDVPMTTEMIFRLGSITKQFTAASILLLDEEGKLNIKEDIRKYLPDYPNHEAVITVENLLTHTSGIPSFTRSPNRLEIEQMELTTDEILTLFKDKPLNFQPGEKYSYSNSGYNVLGAIIESVSGRNYEEFIEKRVFEKLGMKHSFYDHPEEIIKNKMPGYEKDTSGYKLAPYVTMCAPFSAGGLRSNVLDLARWNKALHDGELISKEKLAKAFLPFKLNSGEFSDYGYGWFLKSFLGHIAYFHGGSIVGFRASGLYIPEQDIYVAILSNDHTLDANYLNFIISSLLIGKEIKENTQIDIGALDLYSGTYELGRNQIEIINNYTHLSIIAPWVQGDLITINLDEFYVPGEMFSYVFKRDTSGLIDSITVKNYFFGDEFVTAKRLTK